MIEKYKFLIPNAFTALSLTSGLIALHLIYYHLLYMLTNVASIQIKYVIMMINAEDIFVCYREESIFTIFITYCALAATYTVDVRMNRGH